MTDHQDEQEQIARRRAKLVDLRAKGVAFPNDFRRDSTAADVHQRFDAEAPEILAEQANRTSVAGRIMSRRVQGKTTFAHLQDSSGRIQLFLRRDEIGEEAYAEFKGGDLGDIVGVTGTVFKTKTGELSVRVETIRLLTKALRPLPEKYHGLADQETRYRQRYLDLIANEQSREVFRTRSNVVDTLRRFLGERGYLEVETPMMQVIPGGAVARPFITHHNALDMQLYLRVAPELNLKRLVVGGFEKVFEINRNFRNEGLSTQHNPEFTMLEFYEAYADYEDMMDITEQMLRACAERVHGSLTVNFQGKDYDLGQPFARMSVEESIVRYNADFKVESIRDVEYVTAYARALNVTVEDHHGLGKVLIEIFEKTVEPNLDQPMFITQYPAEVSPLSRRSDDDPFVTDRFELFIAGTELANGFSELNDAEDQAERFRDQVKSRGSGDLEAMYYDEDYVCALEHGLPPTAGEGVGVDRLVMFLADCSSIRDVLLFPHMRPRQKVENDA
jgi:lysyl-tRNA synthetase class 2